MNKYIYSDIATGVTSMKIGITNALTAVKNGETKEIVFEKHIPVSLVLECCDLLGIPRIYLNEYLSNWTIEYKNLKILGISRTGYMKITNVGND